MDEKTVPPVRFDGFTNAWEQRKGSRAVPALRFKADDGSDFPDWEKKRLDKTGTFYGGLSGKSSSDFTNGNAQFLTYMNVYKHAFARQDLTSSVKISEKESPNHVEYGDILFTQSSETVEEVGLSSVYLFKDRPYLNSFCMGFHPNSLSELDPRYMGYCMRSEPVRRQIMVEGQGISRINIAASRLGTIKFFLPSLIEQTKIATVLSTVDSTIALCQRKLDLLTQAKKALMQQIFSQKLRFKADDGSDFPEWEKKRIGDVAFQLKKSIDPRNTPDQLFYEYSMPAFDEKKEPHLSYGYEMASSRKILDQSCLLINKLNVRKQRIWLVSNPQKNAVSSAEFVPFASRHVNLKFLHYLALSDRFTAYLMDSSSGSSNSQKRVTPDVIEDYEVAFPSLPEQQKIASCLSSADALIDQAGVKLEQWQEVKKSLLQQMFV